ncbi:MAG: phosphohydrolase [Verrucomicrobiales bacterium]|nr:phosphohydrolase [Verrucomicrobiales bacterium]
MKHVATLISALLLWNVVADGQTIISDDYNVGVNGTGFSLNNGVNSGINPPTTRLTGTVAPGLRYISTGTKTNTAFSISGNKLRVTSAANPGRITLSTNGTSAFNFAAALGTAGATVQKPIIYDLTISMANNSVDLQRCSFAIGSAEGDATTWDFGLQVFRTADTDNYYTIQKRIDTGSSGLAADINTFITNTVPGTYGTEITFLMRVTDAGSETNSFNSRVQLSMDGGFSWFYDTDSDSVLPSGWRLNGAGRYIMWDVAPDAGPVTYDNFFLSPVPVTATPIAPANGAQNIGAGAALKVAVSNSIPGNLTVTYYGREVGKPYPGRDFLIPVLPDTQNYSDYSHDGLNGRWYSQTEWIITNHIQKNIAYVAQLGDIVQNGDLLSGSPNDEEWGVATNAMYRLENSARTLRPFGIPYGCSVGNHDQEPNGDPDGTTTHYNQCFGTAHFAGKPYYGGHYSTNSDSFFNLFTVSGLDFIVFSFEYGRYGSGVMSWAEDVLATNQNRRVIVMTHHAGSDYTPSNLSNTGDAVLATLGPYTNFFLMLGGHVFNGTGWGEGSRSDTVSGHTVRTLVSDYQNRPSGGDGLMRLMYFSPSNNLVSIKTYSPYTDQFETDADSEFSFTYKMQLPTGPGTPGTAYVALGTNVNVAIGAQNSFSWSGLQANKTYEWYARVTDQAGNTILSPARRFNTGANTAPVVSNQTLTVIGDRATQLTLPAFDANGDPLTFQTNSRPLRGLNYNFDPFNGTITYLPAHRYRGPDQFTYQVSDSVANSGVANFALTVIAPPDTNTNGLPDAWETTYGITDPNADADGDGQSNLAEYLANTNPTNGTSVLKIIGATHQESGLFDLTWASIGGTRYRIQSTPTLTNTFTDLIRFIDVEMDSAPYGSPSTQSFTDTTQTNASRFYRVKVTP